MLPTQHPPRRDSHNSSGSSDSSFAMTSPVISGSNESCSPTSEAEPVSQCCTKDTSDHSLQAALCRQTFDDTCHCIEDNYERNDDSLSLREPVEIPWDMEACLDIAGEAITAAGHVNTNPGGKNSIRLAPIGGSSDVSASTFTFTAGDALPHQPPAGRIFRDGIYGDAPPKGAEDGSVYNGKTALHIAAESGKSSMIQILLRLKANALAQDHLGRTALHLAVERGQDSAVYELLKCPGVCHVQTRNGQTALHLAASLGNEQIVSKLVEAGSDVEAKDGNGQTALHLAVLGGHDSILDILVRGGANVNAQIKM